MQKKNDTATMVLQEKELYKLSRNMSASTRKGPSDAIRKARWRVEQLNVVKDFVEIFDDIETVILEGQEANEPTLYEPKQRASFKPPKYEESQKNFTTKKVSTSKKKTWLHGKSKSKSKSIDDDVQKEIEEIPNAPNAEEVEENENDKVCKHRMVHNRRRKHGVECAQKKMSTISLKQKRKKVKKKMAMSIPKVYLKELLEL